MTDTALVIYKYGQHVQFPNGLSSVSAYLILIAGEEIGGTESGAARLVLRYVSPVVGSGKGIAPALRVEQIEEHLAVLTSLDS